MTDAPEVYPPTYKNQRSGLIGCGIVQLAFGVLLLGICALMVLGMSMAARTGQPPMPAGLVVYTSLLYLGLAALFATLGIGSMMARRWSRPLILILSWGWLACGVLGSVAMFFVLPRMFDSLPPQQAAAKPIMTGCVVVFFALFFVLVPLLFVLFYRRPDVKATVEQADPTPRWTDRVPLPLLGFAMWIFLGAVSVGISSFMYKALPFGGTMLVGWQGKAVMWFFALLMLWIAVGSYRRLTAAWWSALVLVAMGIAYAVMFAMYGDYARYGEAMGMPQDAKQAAMMQAMYSSPFFYAWMVILWGAYLGFLFYIRRYFVESRPAPHGNGGL
jgi:hypothetical protein